MALIDMTEQKWGRLTPIERVGSDAYKAAIWLCQCDCGEQVIVRGTSMRIGKTRSCGCLQRETAIETARITGSARKGTKKGDGNGRKPYQRIGRAPTHGHSYGSPTYLSWKGIKQRCLNPNAPNYPLYGGRGIKVCDRWLSFENFLADMGERPLDPPGWTSNKGYWSIDRIDNDGDYEPGNVRWATKQEQIKNRRSYKRRWKKAPA